jgi:hypothetical protein
MKPLIPSSIGLMLCSLLLPGCTTPRTTTAAGPQKQVLKVRWQRLVDAKGQTCDRCSSTEKATEQGVKTLRRALKPLDIDVVLDKSAVSPSEFTKDPLQSNRIWIGAKPIEEWLQAKVGKSQCCGACGDAECRTLTVDGKTYDTIPAELILKAGLLAGATMIGSQPSNPWNPVGQWSQDAGACCPPAAQGQKK